MRRCPFPALQVDLTLNVNHVGYNTSHLPPQLAPLQALHCSLPPHLTKTAPACCTATPLQPTSCIYAHFTGTLWFTFCLLLRRAACSPTAKRSRCAPSYAASPTISTSCLGAYVSFLLCQSALLFSLSCTTHLAQLSRELSASPVWSIFRMRSVSYLRTTLPAAATLPRAHTHLPLDLVAILNS